MNLEMPFRNTRGSQAVFILSLVVSAFWCLAYNANVYQFAITGAIFELLWLPMIAMIFVLPVLSLHRWYRVKFSIKSHYLHALLVIASLALYLVTRN